MTEQERREQDAKERSVHQLRVYVVGGGFQYIQMFFEAGFTGARNVEDADIICFTGGEDVDPRLYGEEPLTVTRFNRKRDDTELEIYADAVAANKPMIGICRGGQFLNVANGGKLWQHVNNHAVHGTHPIVDMRTGETIEGMTSTHHQMMIPADGQDVEYVALAELSTEKIGYRTTEERDEPLLDDVEVIWYPNTMCLCFQPHPEFRHGPCRDYFLSLVDEYIMPAC